MPKNDVGKNFAEVSTRPQSDISRMIYGKYNTVIAEALLKKFPEKKILDCLELGGGAGALVRELKILLDTREVIFTNIDQSSELLEKDAYSENKLIESIEDIDPAKIGRFDVALMRYVLNYNSPDVQKEILEKITQLLRSPGIFVLHHVGAKNTTHKNLLNQLFFYRRSFSKAHKESVGLADMARA